MNGHIGFNPRGQAHSDFLTAAIVADLRMACPQVDDGFATMELELRHNVGLTGERHTLAAALAAAANDEDAEVDPNVDGVLLRTGVGETGARILAPLAIENKTIMTAHGKARTNRWNDAKAFAEHVHMPSPATVAAFTITINTSLTYKNPDAFARTAKSSGSNSPGAAAATIGLFQSMRMRSATADPLGRCEAAFIVVVDYDGETAARLVTAPPAPQPGEPFSYE